MRQLWREVSPAWQTEAPATVSQSALQALNAIPVCEIGQHKRNKEYSSEFVFIVLFPHQVPFAKSKVAVVAATSACRNAALASLTLSSVKCRALNTNRPLTDQIGPETRFKPTNPNIQNISEPSPKVLCVVVHIFL